MININRKTIRSQDWIKKDCNPVSAVTNCPEKYFSLLTPIQRRIWEYFLFLSKNFKEIYVSQSMIAQYVGCSRQYVNECIQIFKKDGLIVSNYRHKKTCLYKISSYFKNLELCRRLSRIMSLFLILPFCAAFQSETTQNRNLYLYINNFPTGGRTMEVGRCLNNQMREHKEKDKPKYQFSNDTLQAISDKTGLSYGLVKSLDVYPENVLNTALNSYLKNKSKISHVYAWIKKACVCQKERISNLNYITPVYKQPPVIEVAESTYQKMLRLKKVGGIDGHSPVSEVTLRKRQEAPETVYEIEQALEKFKQSEKYAGMDAFWRDMAVKGYESRITKAKEREIDVH